MKISHIVRGWSIDKCSGKNVIKVSPVLNVSQLGMEVMSFFMITVHEDQLWFFNSKWNPS